MTCHYETITWRLPTELLGEHMTGGVCQEPIIRSMSELSGTHVRRKLVVQTQLLHRASSVGRRKQDAR